MSNNAESSVTVVESGNGPYAQFVTAGHHVMGADEPERLGGRDTGPSPYEHIMAGLGACTVMTLRRYANRQGWPLEKLTVGLRHEAAPAPDGFVDRFFRTIVLEGNLSDEQRRRLLEIAEECPVSRTLRRASEIVTEFAGSASAVAAVN